MQHLFVALICLFVTICHGANVTLLSDLQQLNLSSGAEIGLNLSSSIGFTSRWSSYDAPDYIVGVKPFTHDDVAKVVGFATKSSTPFLSTGGGHGFSITLGKLQSGILLDLSNFNNVSVDTNDNTLTIGGAVRFADILEPLDQAQKELPIGSVSCVGMVGATLGGGVSRYNGLHGMLLDSLASVKMVTASGNIVTASTSENSELFWGIRGAGFNYGTVLEATYFIYDHSTPLVLNADFLFAPNASQDILQYFKTFEIGLPAELSLIFLAAYASEFGGSFIIVNAVYTGSQSEGEKLLQPLFNASPKLKNLTMVPWASVNAVSFFGADNEPCTGSTPHNVYGGAVHYFDIPTFQNFYEDYNELISSNPVELDGTVYFIEFFAKQAVEAVASNATAYPWRNITAHLLFNFAYDTIGGPLDNKINQFGRAARKNFTDASGFAQPELYVSYGHGDEDLETLYSAQNLPFLRSLKAEWDPNNVYRYNYPLLP
ncbi:hypothetical protein OCU04_008526 [Sclerotinia nivalis]|uniref:FAD-binding PCMH-type domain-containing protein n=1 Tax=Sclerotinia nivalis TaxID=352851 RepID=A0A9X0AIA2_9HELO|nr:hypothetical protein OCU04_008526 [Sclerotinia nivalis]